MNANIPYLKNEMANEVECLSTSKLSAYILTEEEQDYIDKLSDDTASIISNLLLTASIKAGSSLYTQPQLNKVYARRDSTSYKASDKDDFKTFLNTKMVGNKIIDFPELGGL